MDRLEDLNRFEKVVEEKYHKKNFRQYCPGIGINRKKIKLDSHNYHPLIGNINFNYVGYSRKKSQRLSSSSGGIITEIICYILEKGIVQGVYLPMPTNKTEEHHQYQICTKKNIKEIRQFAQSIYVKIPARGALSSIKKFDGKIAFIGLPDQISAMRVISKQENLDHKISYYFGPMVGILMEKSVIDAIKYISNSKRRLEKLRWRHGEWPGKLHAKFIDTEINIDKFYYNYLLPFYCSNESLLQDDFSNELSDISVGDAWLPEYEDIGRGWSLVQSKTFKGEKLLNDLNNLKRISIEKINIDKALRMHEHMIDFKKRGSKYRKKILNVFFIPVPKDYNLKIKFNFSRYLIEMFILLIIFTCKTRISRYIMSKLNQKFLGFIFSRFRIFWKKITKETKRKGLYDNIKSN